MRYKQRLFLCQLDLGVSGAAALAAASAISSADIFNALRASMSEAFGDVGLGAVAASLSVRYYSPGTRLFVVRGPLAAAGELHAALALVHVCRKQPAAFRTLQVCGSTRVLRAALRHWHASIAAGLRGEIARAELALDETFFAALEREEASGAL